MLFKPVAIFTPISSCITTFVLLVFIFNYFNSILFNFCIILTKKYREICCKVNANNEINVAYLMELLEALTNIKFVHNMMKLTIFYNFIIFTLLDSGVGNLMKSVLPYMLFLNYDNTYHIK